MECRLVLDNTVHLSHNHYPFGTRDSLTFDTAISPYTDTLFLYYFIYFTLQDYSRTGTHWGILLPQPYATNNRNIRIERPPPLLATGVTSRRIRIQIICGNYVGQYRTYFWGPWSGCTCKSPNQSDMEETASTRRCRYHLNSRRVPRDYPYRPSTYVMYRDRGLRRPSGRHRFAALT